MINISIMNCLMILMLVTMLMILMIQWRAEYLACLGQAIASNSSLTRLVLTTLPFPLKYKITTFGRIDHHHPHDLRLQVDNILPDLPNIQFAVPILLSLRFCVLYTHTPNTKFSMWSYLNICKIGVLHRRSKNNVH